MFLLVICDMGIEPGFSPTMPTVSGSKIFINGLQVVDANTMWIPHFMPDGPTHPNSKADPGSCTTKLQSGGVAQAVGPGSLDCGAMTIPSQSKFMSA